MILQVSYPQGVKSKTAGRHGIYLSLCAKKESGLAGAAGGQVGADFLAKSEMEKASHSSHDSITK